MPGVRDPDPVGSVTFFGLVRSGFKTGSDSFLIENCVHFMQFSTYSISHQLVFKYNDCKSLEKL